MNATIPLTLTATPPRTRAVAIWLFVCAAMIFAMVVIGGVTRLTESGLSIAEWKPVTGALPPLTQQAWEEEFQRYQQIPEYRERNAGMTLDDYRTIYWWEYTHRLWGRLIGAAFLLPFLWFLWRGTLSRPLTLRLSGVFILGGLQGALGWYMVQSGLADRVDVSPYRLAAHLGLALVIYAAILWIAFGLVRGPRRAAIDSGVVALGALVFATMILGAFVAGNDAGMIYNTFPLMDGQVVPRGYLDFAPWWTNLFENVAAVQFNHRISAYLTVAASFVYWLRRRDVAEPQFAHAILAVTLLQATLGIATLLLAVPIPLAALHQAGALTLLTLTIAAAERGSAAGEPAARAL